MPNTARYFDHPDAAARYAAARPFVHPHILQRVCTLIGCDRFGAVLDVGCGTGQSTVALAEISTAAIGIDPSAAMLAHTPALENVEYRIGTAEQIPLESETVELITVGLAWHWFDAARFLSEVQRVLQPGGWLVLYNSAFPGWLPEHPTFALWFRDVYLARYPSPTRQSRAPASFPLHESGLSFVRHDPFTVLMAMTHLQFVEYLLTQSNVIAAVELGTESLATVSAWLWRETEPHFQKSPVLVPFRVDLDLLRRESSVQLHY